MREQVDFIKIGQRIQQVRKARRLTQEELAEKCGCSSNHLSAIETGINKPSVELLIKLSDILNESVDYFLMDNPHAHPQYIIETQIAEKLNRCTAPTLQVVNSLLDSMLEYQQCIAKQNE